MFRDFSPQVNGMTAPRSGHDRCLFNPWHFNFHASSCFSKPCSHIHITDNSDKHLSLVDSCHFLGTVHFYKHLPLVRIPIATANVTQVKCITSICCPTMSRLAVVFPLHDSAWQANKWRVQKISTIRYATWPSTRIVVPRSQCPGTPLGNAQHFKYWTNNTVVETVLKLFTSLLVQRSSIGALVKCTSRGNGASCKGDVK
jgi:hypothetical protein